MHLITDRSATIDIDTVPLHLGLGARAQPIEGFGFDPEALAAYTEQTASDGPEGRLVMAFETRDSWDVWERHPAGDEVVVCLSGRLTIIREIDGQPDPVELGPRQAMINPANVWHTADVAEPGWILTITPGLGTEHRPR